MQDALLFSKKTKKGSARLADAYSLSVDVQNVALSDPDFIIAFSDESVKLYRIIIVLFIPPSFRKGEIFSSFNIYFPNESFLCRLSFSKESGWVMGRRPMINVTACRAKTGANERSGKVLFA